MAAQVGTAADNVIEVYENERTRRTRSDKLRNEISDKGLAIERYGYIKNGELFISD